MTRYDAAQWYELLYWMLGWEIDAAGRRVTDEEAKRAAERLTARARKALEGGAREEDVRDWWPTKSLTTYGKVFIPAVTIGLGTDPERN